MSATIKDVARIAGVSASTVSRVLNGKGTISEDTKKRIHEVMAALKYVPNDFARSFANGSPRAIALVIDVADSGAYSNNFFNNTVFGIETTAHKNDFSLMIVNGSTYSGDISSVERLVLGKKVDGVIFPVSLVNSDFLHRIEEQRFPCVILGRAEEVSTETSWVDINNTQAGMAATRHMIQRGYRKISFLTDIGSEVFGKDRISGYCRELAAAGLSYEPERIIHAEPNLQSAMELVLSLLTSDSAPDAVVCSSDRLAIAALRAAAKAKLKVPEDFGVLCFDRTAVTDYAEPDITCVEVDTFELGLQAAEILINQIENPEASIRQMLLSTKIIARGSTRREDEGGRK